MAKKLINKDNLLASLPKEWPDNLLPEIQHQIKISKHKVVVLDDDPTGTQTVHNLPILTEWSVETLSRELVSDLVAFYILTNTRSMPLSKAQSLNTEIGHNLIEAAYLVNREFVVVSRSDSTLRGHFPGEVKALADALEQDFDAWLIIPFFLEGGRYTIDDIHYVADGEWLVPASETEFARDPTFSYAKSNLRQWVEEKTAGLISWDSVTSISIEELRYGGPKRVAKYLSNLTRGRICVVNAASMRDLEVFTSGLLIAEACGQQFLYRTAASFVQVRAGLSSQSLLTQADLGLPKSGGGLIVVGSYVPRTTNQVNAILASSSIVSIEVNVETLLDNEHQENEIKRVAHQADQALGCNHDTLIYTSRKLVTGENVKSNISVGQRISESLVSIVRMISTRPRYFIAKGGITSSDVATRGLDVKRAFVMGQILPGVPVWELGSESRYPGLAYIVFPGNVGSSRALTELVAILKLAP